MSKDLEKIKDEIIEDYLRWKLCEVSKLLWDKGLVSGSGGNISVKIPGTRTCLIKPTGMRFIDLRKHHHIVVNFDTREVVKGTLKPSKESPFHTGIYKVRPDVGAVVHAHPATIVAFSAANVPLKRVKSGGGSNLPVAPYFDPGTEELAEGCVNGLGDGYAVIMKHHGLITVGPNGMNGLDIATRRCIGLESAAKAQLMAHILGDGKYDEAPPRGTHPRRKQ
jgi:L-fuculose-phosphate aldolase